MKCFLCALKNINLGIPADQIERIIPVDAARAVSEYENVEMFISIPAILGYKNAQAPHGLVLKTEGKNAVKIIILAPKIEADMEIPDENIHRLPEAFTGAFRYFNGACFTAGGKNLVFILDINKLRESIK